MIGTVIATGIYSGTIIKDGFAHDPTEPSHVCTPVTPFVQATFHPSILNPERRRFLDEHNLLYSKDQRGLKAEARAHFKISLGNYADNVLETLQRLIGDPRIKAIEIVQLGPSGGSISQQDIDLARRHKFDYTNRFIILTFSERSENLLDNINKTYPELLHFSEKMLPSFNPWPTENQAAFIYGGKEIAKLFSELKKNTISLTYYPPDQAIDVIYSAEFSRDLSHEKLVELLHNYPQIEQTSIKISSIYTGVDINAPAEKTETTAEDLKKYTDFIQDAKVIRCLSPPVTIIVD